MHGLSDAGTRSGTHGLNEELGRHRGRGGGGVRKIVCCVGMSVKVSHTLWDCSAYTSIRAQFLLKLKASLGGSYARFETMSSLDKSLFVLGNELWEEHFESLLALVKAYIIDVWEERKSKLYGDVSVLNNPVLTFQLGILGKLLGLMGRIVKGCVREVSLAQVSCILMYVYVAPPTPVGAWSMALGLRQRFEYYYYYISIKLFSMAF